MREVFVPVVNGTPLSKIPQDVSVFVRNKKEKLVGMLVEECCPKCSIRIWRVDIDGTGAVNSEEGGGFQSREEAAYHALSNGYTLWVDL